MNDEKLRNLVVQSSQSTVSVTLLILTRFTFRDEKRVVTFFFFLFKSKLLQTLAIFKSKNRYVACEDRRNKKQPIVQ